MVVIVMFQSKLMLTLSFRRWWGWSRRAAWPISTLVGGRRPLFEQSSTGVQRSSKEFKGDLRLNIVQTELKGVQTKFKGGRSWKDNNTTKWNKESQPKWEKWTGKEIMKWTNEERIGEDQWMNLSAFSQQDDLICVQLVYTRDQSYRGYFVLCRNQAAISWRASGDHQISLNASAERAFANFRDKSAYAGAPR